MRKIDRIIQNKSEGIHLDTTTRLFDRRQYVGIVINVRKEIGTRKF